VAVENQHNLFFLPRVKSVLYMMKGEIQWLMIAMRTASPHRAIQYPQT